MGMLYIPRSRSYDYSYKEVDARLHILRDASERGYGAVSYLQLGIDAGAHRWVLESSKSRVAPSIALPELATVVLGTGLQQFIVRAFDLDQRNTVYWTDSMIVLDYVINTSKRYATYVANRVSFIHSVS